MKEAAAPRPLAVLLLEIVGQAMGLGDGFCELTIQYEGGRVRSWSSRDPRNAPSELLAHDDEVWGALRALVEP